MADKVLISGTGLWKPEGVLTNEELVDCYNAYANRFNSENAEAISAGMLQAKPQSSAAFIQKASGIRQRYIYQKKGVLDLDRMRPDIPKRPNEALSDQAEMAIHAAKDAMARAGKKPAEIDAVIVACAYTQRSYPAIAIEVQQALGIQGFAFDMLVAVPALTISKARCRAKVPAEQAT
ncbi:MAG: beta-ketoacyl-ACP synthase III, partial [Bacteroidota bacterium]